MRQCSRDRHNWFLHQLSALTEEGDSISRELLQQIRRRHGFPTALHVFYRKLNADTAVQGDTIIATVTHG